MTDNTPCPEPMSREQVLAVLDRLRNRQRTEFDGRELEQARAAVAELYDDNERMGNETTECAQIVGEALAGKASLHIGHLPSMCRELAHERTALYERCEALERAVENKQDALELLWREHEFYHYEGCPTDRSGIQTECTCFHGMVNQKVVVALAYTGTEASDAEGGG